MVLRAHARRCPQASTSPEARAQARARETVLPVLSTARNHWNHGSGAELRLREAKSENGLRTQVGGEIKLFPPLTMENWRSGKIMSTENGMQDCTSSLHRDSWTKRKEQILLSLIRLLKRFISTVICSRQYMLADNRSARSIVRKEDTQKGFHTWKMLHPQSALRVRGLN